MSDIATNSNLPHFAVCIKNEGYTVSLELHKIYRVLPDAEAAQHEELHVVDESGEDYLFPADWFRPIKVPKALEKMLITA